MSPNTCYPCVSPYRPPAHGLRPRYPRFALALDLLGLKEEGWGPTRYSCFAAPALDALWEWAGTNNQELRTNN